MWVIQGPVSLVAPLVEVAGVGRTEIPATIIWPHMEPRVSYT